MIHTSFMSQLLSNTGIPDFRGFDFRDFDFRDFLFNTIYNSILFSSTTK